MSRTNFDAIAEQQPAVGGAVRAVAAWIDRRPGVRFLELGRLARELPQFTPAILALAIHALIDAGELRPAFRLRDRAGVLLPGEFPDEELVPLGPTLSADAESVFEATPEDVVEGYLLGADRGPD